MTLQHCIKVTAGETAAMALKAVTYEADGKERLFARLILVTRLPKKG